MSQDVPPGAALPGQRSRFYGRLVTEVSEVISVADAAGRTWPQPPDLHVAAEQALRAGAAVVVPPDTGARAAPACAWVLLESPEGPVGVLSAVWGAAHEPDDGQLQLLQGVANVLAGARARARREAEAMVRALHDPLTGLPTRPLLHDRLDHAVARAARGGAELAVLLLDLDRFKEVNDRCGHAAGDALLASLGPRLAACVRTGDTVARLGGDEFVVLCEEVEDRAFVLDLRERLRREAAQPVELPGGLVVAVGGSVGCTFSGHAGTDATALLQAAADAMYRDRRGQAR